LKLIDLLFFRQLSIQVYQGAEFLTVVFLVNKLLLRVWLIEFDLKLFGNSSSSEK